MTRLIPGHSSPEFQTVNMARSHPTHDRFAAAIPVTIFNLWDLCEDKADLMLFLMKSGLLGDFSGQCEQCEKGNVFLVKDKDSYTWQCSLRKCRKKIAVRNGSFFSGSHLDFKTILMLIFGWLNELPQKFMKDTLKISSPNTLVDWYNFCREVCVDILLKDNHKIGGPGHIVEIDESKFGKRKFHKGRRVDGCWVLGGIDRETKETFFQVVPDRTTETLLPILIENIHPESIVISDCWKSYSTLSQHFKEHRNINHSIQFVDPKDKRIHTNTIESNWRVLKRNVLPRSGTVKSLYSTYFSMYCVRKRYLTGVECPFKAFLELIKRAYPLNKVESTPRKGDFTNFKSKSTRDVASQTEEPIPALQNKRRRIDLPDWSDDSDFE